MKSYNLLSRVRRNKVFYMSGAEPVVAPYILECKFDAKAPNEKWFTDVSYLTFGQRTLYLYTTMDVFNREIISWIISELPTLHLSIEILN